MIIYPTRYTECETANERGKRTRTSQSSAIEKQSIELIIEQHARLERSILRSAAFVRVCAYCRLSTEPSEFVLPDCQRNSLMKRRFVGSSVMHGVQPTYVINDKINTVNVGTAEWSVRFMRMRYFTARNSLRGSRDTRGTSCIVNSEPYFISSSADVT